MLRPRPAPSHPWSSWLPVLTPRGPGRRRRRPTEARPQLLGQHFDRGSGTAVLSGPAPLLEPAHDHDPAALRQRLGCMLCLVAPHDHGEEGRLLLPPDQRWPPRKLALAMLLSVCRPFLLPGRAVCPALGPGGRWTPWHAESAPGASDRANEVGPTGSTADRWSARVPGWLAALAAGGRACQHRPARSLHPGRGGRTRLPPQGPLAGPRQASAGVRTLSIRGVRRFESCPGLLTDRFVNRAMILEHHPHALAAVSPRQ
jgi:hypothetical protein